MLVLAPLPPGRERLPPFALLVALCHWPLPEGRSQRGLPDQNNFSFALTISAGYVEMHKLMFSDAEIFC
jgi:hypothetical protein